MSTLKVNSINHLGDGNISIGNTTGGVISVGNTTGVNVVGVLTATNLDYTTAPFNAVINGGMRISQRTSEVHYGGAITGITGDTFVVDRWELDLNVGTWTVTHSNESPSSSGIQYSQKAECTTAGTLAGTSLVRFRQKFEGQQLECFGDKEYSLSFWFKSNVNGVYSATMVNGVSSKTTVVSFTVSDGNWHHYKFNMGSGAGAYNYYNSENGELTINLVVGSTYSSGTPNTGWQTSASGLYGAGQTANCNVNGSIAYLTGVQLQPGPVCTPFINESYGETLMKCYRYYVRLYTNTSDYAFGFGYKYAASASAITVPLPTRMRTTPSCQFNGLRIRGMHMSGSNNSEDVSSLGGMSFSYGNFQSFTANTSSNQGGIGQAVVLTNNASNNTSYIAFQSEM